jgi:hypothetical protein
MRQREMSCQHFHDRCPDAKTDPDPLCGRFPTEHLRHGGIHNFDLPFIESHVKYDYLRLLKAKMEEILIAPYECAAPCLPAGAG